MFRRRLLYLALFALMALFAGLQVNDPDPWLWVPLYGGAALLLLLAALGYAPRWPLMALLLAYLVVAATVFPGFLEWLLHHPLRDIAATMHAERPHVEDSRELLGLVVAACCLAILWRWPPPGGREAGP